MNLPDITLLFQMIHFAIAYAILRKFVFAPSLCIIQESHNRSKQLQAKVDKTDNEYQALLKEQQKQWLFIQKSLFDMTPQVNQKICTKGLKDLALTPVDGDKLSNEQKQSVKQMLHDELLDIGQ